MRPFALLFASLVVLGGTEAARSDDFLIPRDLYQGGLRQQHDRITFCLWPGSPMHDVDKAVGQAIADALLLNADFYEIQLPVGNDEEVFQQTLFVALQDHCDAAMSLNLAWSPLPSWLTPSRPYYSAPVVLAVAKPAYRRLADVPAGQPVGSLIFTTADYQFSAYDDSLPASQRWFRIPYDSADHLVADIASGVVAGGLLAAPDLFAATGGHPDAKGIHLVATDPLKVDAMDLGIGYLERDTYLRTAIDQAIGSIDRDGTLSSIIASAGLPPSKP